jgi:VWFA-related protein
MRQAASLIAISLTLSPGTTLAQRPAPPTFRSASEAIVVDVIVRDRKGKPVTDLSLQDFELREDGVLQEIRAMTLVSPDGLSGPPVAPSSSTSTAPPTPSTPAAAAPPGNSVVALVFDRLTPDARALAHRAALSYLERPYRPDDFIGVFVIDLSMHALQTYTKRPIRPASFVRYPVSPSAACRRVPTRWC